ncbi:hypothetical protein WJX77_009330 [Trebouxia sp. C0004]
MVDLYLPHLLLKGSSFSRMLARRSSPLPVDLHNTGLKDLRNLPSAQPGPINIGQTLVGGSTRAGVLSSDQEHLNAKAGTDQTVHSKV